MHVKEASVANDMTRKPLPHLILSLPQELQFEILSYLSVADAAQLQRVSRSFLTIVKNCELDYVRVKAARTIPRELKPLLPVPDRSRRSFQWLGDYSRRMDTCITLAVSILYPLRNKALASHPLHPRCYDVRYERLLQGSKDIWHRSVLDLAIDLFLLDHFFTSYRDFILRRALANCTTFNTPPSSSIFVRGTSDCEADQLTLLRTYSGTRLRSCYFAYGALLHELDTKLLCHSDKCCQAPCREHLSTRDIATLLLFGGLRETRRVLDAKSPALRRIALLDFTQALEPAGKDKARDRWRGLGLPSDVLDGLRVEGRLETLRIGLPPLQLLWLPPALVLMQESGMLHEMDITWRQGDVRRERRRTRMECLWEVFDRLTLDARPRA